jgi:hypothetical protein
MYRHVRLESMGSLHRFTILACAVACGLALAAPAGASQWIAGNASHIRLAVNRHGVALVTYSTHGTVRHVLAWGAINARFRPPTEDGPEQVRFKLDYSGGWATQHRPVWRRFRNACRRYDGPALAWFVAGCKVPDGSYWALQSWQTLLPDLGFAPWFARQRTWWLHLSHWNGPLAKLDVYRDWAYSIRAQELFGQYTYKGVGIRGFGTTRHGVPTDGYGRLVYIDTHNSVYGRGWRRETSIVASGPPGLFCHGFVPVDPYAGWKHPPGTPHRNRGPGNGDMYRVTVNGPGVTPDLMWQGAALGRFDPNDPADASLERQMNAKLDSVRAGWHKCLEH